MVLTLPRLGASGQKKSTQVQGMVRLTRWMESTNDNDNEMRVERNEI